VHGVRVLGAEEPGEFVLIGSWNKRRPCERTTTPAITATIARRSSRSWLVQSATWLMATT
jgi:hypothetical protein